MTKNLLKGRRITIELVDEIRAKLDSFDSELPLLVPGDSSWPQAREGWLEEVGYASVRLREVRLALQSRQRIRTSYHGSIVNVCLNMIEDLKLAKSVNFDIQKLTAKTRGV